MYIPIKLRSLFWIVIKIVWLKARRSTNLIWESRVITNLTKQSTEIEILEKAGHRYPGVLTHKGFIF